MSRLDGNRSVPGQSARRRLACGLSLALALGVGLVADLARAETPARTGVLVGGIRDEVTGQPVAGATIVVEGTAQVVESDTTGRFQVTGLPVGTYQVLVTRPGFGAVRRTDLVVNADRETDVQMTLLALPALREEVDVVATAFEQRRDVPNSMHGMSYEEIRRAPGALGDLGRMLQAMPGVVSPNDDRNDIVARGGSPIENLTLVDDMEVPNINHFAAQGASGGAIAMLDAELISGATFIAGGLPAQYGNRLSSALEISLREGSRRRFQVEADVSMGGAGAVLEGPLGENGSWLASVRRSFLDLVAGAFGESAIPQYGNYLVKAVREVGRGRLTLVSLGGMDSYDQTGDDAKSDGTEPHAVDMTGWRTVTGLNWQAWGPRSVFTLGVSHAQSGYRVDVRDRRLDQVVSRNRSGEGETTLKGELSAQFGPPAALRAGASVKRFSSGFDLDQPLGWEDPFSPDPTRVNAIDTHRDDATVQAGGYAQLTLSPNARFDLTLGGRADHYGYADRWAVAPRASLVLHAGHGIDLSASYGHYSQMPPYALIVGIPANRALSLMRAEQAVVGLAVTPRSDIRLTLEAYDKRYRDYPVSVQHPFLSLASLGGYYDISEILMPMRSQGSGRARGVEISLQKKLTGSLWGQASYAYSRSEHAASDGVWRPGGFDLPHVLSLTGGYRMSETFELSAKFAYASGRPITPLLETESREQDRTIFDAARVFTERTPAYHRLDLRADRRFHRRWGTLTLYLEADNVYDRKNVRRYLWNSKSHRVDTELQLSLLVLGGLTVQF